MKKYIVTSKSGFRFAECETLKEAKSKVTMLENFDRLCGEYEKDYYTIESFYTTNYKGR